jgi:hypothetical protein
MWLTSWSVSNGMRTGTARGSRRSPNQMGRIVAISRDLRADTVSSVTRSNPYPLPLRPIGPIRKDLGDDLESTRVAETGEYERNVSSYMPVLVIQPARQGREHVAVVTFHNLPGRRDLPPECLLALELINQGAR